MKKMIMYQTKLLKRAGLLGICALTVLFAACDDFLRIPQPSAEDGRAAVFFAVADAGMRSVLPQVSFSGIAVYKLSGAADGGAETELQEFTGQDVLVYLTPGTWNFTLNAYNDDGDHILQGSVQDQEISLTEDNHVEFILLPLNGGEGAIQITINFPDNAGITRITVTNTNTNTTEETDITAGEGQFVYTKDSVTSGDYFHIFRLYRGANLGATVSELVLVRNYLTSAKVITLTGYSLKQMYYVTFNKGGAASGPDEQLVMEGEKAGDPEFNMTREGYIFGGWYKETACITLWDFDSDIVSSNTTIYAKWTAVYYVAYNANGGTGTMEQTTFAYGVAQNLRANAFTRAGYTFAGWAMSAAGTPIYTNGQSVNNLTTTAGATITLYAVWEDNRIVLDGSFGSVGDIFDWLYSNVQNNTIYIVEVETNETIYPQTLSWSGKSDVVVHLKGVGAIRTLSLATNGSIFTVESGITLILDDNITLQGRASNTASLVKVNSGGTLIMKEGSVITGNTTTTAYGGGVYVGGTFIMDGGTISDNTVSVSTGGIGGGVYMDTTGIFTMNGGTISGNKASASYSYSANASITSYSYGGGVYAGAGTFTMNDGTISGNNAATIASQSSTYGYNAISYSYGGGVYVTTGTFTMNGGNISNNTATATSYSYRGYANSYSYGGGVCGTGTTGIITMNGGSISDNTASASFTDYYQYPTSTAFGGGVYAEGAFNMSDGTISGNTASADATYGTSYGGGVYVTRIFNKTGGTIYGYTDGDSNSNAVKNASGTVLDVRGHAVYAGGSTVKGRDRTAGTIVNLSYDASVSPVESSGVWDF